MHDVLRHNQRAWDALAARGCAWTRPVDGATVAAARRGEFDIHLRLTPTRRVPDAWLPRPLAGARILCLACGGGQQAPLLAAAGAEVTVFDLSPAQLDADRGVAAREGLRLRAVQGSMDDLSAFADESFDVVFNPVSVTYVPEVRPVFRECARVLRPGGGLLFAAPWPHIYLFEGAAWDRGELRAANRLPFRSTDELDGEQAAAFMGGDRPMEHSHTMEALLGGQLEAGFVIAGFYEDGEDEAVDDPLRAFCSKYFATRAVRI